MTETKTLIEVMNKLDAERRMRKGEEKVAWNRIKVLEEIGPKRDLKTGSKSDLRTETTSEIKSADSGSEKRIICMDIISTRAILISS